MGPGGVHTDISTRPSHKQVYVLFLTSFFLNIQKKISRMMRKLMAKILQPLKIFHDKNFQNLSKFSCNPPNNFFAKNNSCINSLMITHLPLYHRLISIVRGPIKSITKPMILIHNVVESLLTGLVVMVLSIFDTR